MNPLILFNFYLNVWYITYKNEINVICHTPNYKWERVRGFNCKGSFLKTGCSIDAWMLNFALTWALWVKNDSKNWASFEFFQFKLGHSFLIPWLHFMHNQFRNHLCTRLHVFLYALRLHFFNLVLCLFLLVLGQNK